MPVRAEETSKTSCNQPRKRINLSAANHSLPKRSLVARKGSHSPLPLYRSSMLNGYLTGDGHNKSSTDESPCSEANGTSPVATLCNLGNTCFLNSVLYTLRFAPSFLHNLHHLVSDLKELNSKQAVKTKSSSLGRNVGSSSKSSWSNKDLFSMSLAEATTKAYVQLTTEELHLLYESLHSSEIKEDSEPFQAETYLQSLRNVNPIFEGNQQHDAHELLVCLLNNIRETCQLLAEQTKSNDDYNKRQHLESRATNGIGCQLDLALSQSHPPPSVTPLSNTGNSLTSRLLVRKSWKKKKERVVVAESADVIREPGEPDVTDSLVNGFINLKPLTLIAEDGSLAEMSTNDPEIAPTQTAHDVQTEQLNNFIADDFEGMSVLMTTCLECEHTTSRNESFCDICVPITIERKDEDDSDCDNSSKSISSLFQSAIVTNEFLRDLNKYWCEQCLRLNEARRSVRYETLPRLLVLQLKRFSSTFNSIVSVSKINDYMPTPLTLACFCVQCSHLPEDQRPHQYKLYGIIMHLGATIASGHYVAYVKASDNSTNYYHCKKDKRKVSSLSASGGKGGNCDKVGGFFKFFRQKSSNNTELLQKPVNNSYYTNICRSLDCCGIKLNRSFIEGHQGVNGGSQNGLNDNITNPVNQNVTDTAVPGPVWLECDDENVRPLTLKEFEEVLAPKSNRRSSQTPYLLFYAKSP